MEAIGSAPLGVRPDRALTDDQRRALQSLHHYDLTPVRLSLLYDGVLPPAWVDEAIWEFRRFMGLCVLTPLAVPMTSRPIDEVWHTFLLHTELYAAFCQRIFGFFAHHQPTPRGPAAVVPETPEDSYSFAELYRETYGTLGRLWQPELLDTTEQDIAAVSAKLTALAHTLSPGEQGALQQLLALAARGYECSQQREHSESRAA
jgi:hypothetical protein